jgi:hypothetical protein
MKSAKTILAKYRQADSDERLYLYLDHPDLRAEFGAIDRTPHIVPKKGAKGFFHNCFRTTKKMPNQTNQSQ